MKRNNIIKWGGMVLAAAVLATGVWSVNQETDEITIPQTVKFIDTEDGSVIVEEEEVPLSTKPTVKVKTTTKKSVKKKKLKTKAKKTKKTTKKTTTKRTTTKENSKQKVKTETTVKKTVQSKTKKKSKIKTVTTTVKTTVKTTTTNKPATTTTTSTSTSTTTVTAAATASSSSSSTVTTILMRNLATAADANVLEAYELMGFTTEINPSKTYSGYFNSVDHKIVMHSKKASTAYHELGHFVGWLAGNVDTKSEFVAIYNSEKDQVTSSNKAYVTKNSSEYFAECYKMYVMEPTVMKKIMPQSYAYIQKAVAKITTARAKAIKEYYEAVYWK